MSDIWPHLLFFVCLLSFFFFPACSRTIKRFELLWKNKGKRGMCVFFVLKILHLRGCDEYFKLQQKLFSGKWWLYNNPRQLLHYSNNLSKKIKQPRSGFFDKEQLGFTTSSSSPRSSLIVSLPWQLLWCVCVRKKKRKKKNEYRSCVFGQCDSDARFEKFSESEKNFYGFFVQGGFFFLWVFCVGFFFPLGIFS